MHMVFGDVTFQDFNIEGFTNLPDQIPDADGHVSKEDRFAVLGDPNQMDL